ncbi:hypothetical protein LY78DRAFT_375167 [Colletotrichum sublineola]|nr:hypothetical protein LY78DRAFT_375167 [Colletotrichum sublineola]
MYYTYAIRACTYYLVFIYAAVAVSLTTAPIAPTRSALQTELSRLLAAPHRVALHGLLCVPNTISVYLTFVVVRAVFLVGSIGGVGGRGERGGDTAGCRDAVRFATPARLASSTYLPALSNDAS